MKRIKIIFALILFLLCITCIVACSDANKEIDFVEKYKVDLESGEDVSRLLQKAIDELPDGGVLFLRDGTYPIESVLVLKENMTLKLSDNAILLNRRPETNPTMAFNHPFKHDEAKGNSNITIEGGIWDMNGQLSLIGIPKNLPNLQSINALGFGYASNITVRNVTFRDCYNGHAMQIAGCDNVTIENCRFEGQWFRGSGDTTRELIQIEPGTVKGYPYITVENKAPSTNVTIRGCYFGGSAGTSSYMIAIGTHFQLGDVKCSNIVIEECTFDNSAFATIRFMAYDGITIRNNTFNLTSDSNQPERYGILADTYRTGVESTNNITIEGNTFNIDAPNAVAMSITTNNNSPKKIDGICIKNNTITSTNGGTGINLYLIENCVIEGNTIEGFDTPIAAKDCDDHIQSDVEVTIVE